MMGFNCSLMSMQRRRQLLLNERAAHARQEAAANRSLMATLDSLMAECRSDIAALQAEIYLADDRRHEAAANAEMSVATGSGATVPSTRLCHMMAATASAAPIANNRPCHGVAANAVALVAPEALVAPASLEAPASLAAQALQAALPSKRLRHAMAAQASTAAAASPPSLRLVEALMAAFKKMDGGGAHPFSGGIPHPPQMRACSRRPRHRVCQRHGPQAPNLLVSLLCGRRHWPRTPNYGGWA